MAHFAKLDEDNKVTEVVVVDNSVIEDENGDEQESLGQAFLKGLYGDDTVWQQTSYNNNIRGIYATVGYTYDASTDKFIPPTPYASWVDFDEETHTWQPPIPHPLKDLKDEDFPTGYPQEFIDNHEKQPPYIYEWNEEKHQADNTKGWELIEGYA